MMTVLFCNQQCFYSYIELHWANNMPVLFYWNSLTNFNKITINKYYKRF